MPKSNTVAIPELQLFRTIPECEKWFEYQDNIAHSIQLYLKDPLFDQFTEQVTTWIENYLLEPKSLYIQIESFIELSERLPKTFLQLIGIGLTPQQILSDTFKQVHRKCPKERAGDHELEIQKDILAGDASLLSNAFPSIEEKIKLLQLQKSKLETQEQKRYEIAIDLLRTQLEGAHQTIADRDTTLQQLQTSLADLKEVIAKKDIEIATLSARCDTFKATLARMQVENARRFQQQELVNTQRFEQQQSDIAQLRLELEQLKKDPTKETETSVKTSPVVNPSLEKINTEEPSAPTESPPSLNLSIDIDIRRYLTTIFSKEAAAGTSPSSPSASPK